MGKAEKFEEALTILREQILRGEYGIRGYLPSRSILEREFGISHSVMNQVILHLQGEGLIASGNGSRRLTVTPPRRRVPLRDVPFVSFLREQGLEPVTKALEQPERKQMPADLAREFGVPEGTPYVARVRLDGTQKIPYRITSKYYLASLIDDETLAGMQANDKYDAILDIKKKHGIVATYMTEDIIARLPTTQEQEVLEIVRTAPVMEVKRTCFDREGGNVLWFNRIVLVASLFVFHQEYRGEALWKE